MKHIQLFEDFVNEAHKLKISKRKYLEYVGPFEPKYHNEYLLHEHTIFKYLYR